MTGRQIASLALTEEVRTSPEAGLANLHCAVHASLATETNKTLSVIEVCPFAGQLRDGVQGFLATRKNQEPVVVSDPPSPTVIVEASQDVPAVRDDNPRAPNDVTDALCRKIYKIDCNNPHDLGSEEDRTLFDSL